MVLNHDVADRTEEICRGFGAVVYREPWKGHIAQKNSAAAKATQPWVFGLDADEVVSEPLKAELRTWLENTDACRQFAAFSVPRMSFYLGRWIRHGDWYPDRKTRIWRRGQAKWTGIDPHDFVEVSGEVKPLRGDLLHYSFKNLAHHLQKVNAYGNLFASGRLARNRPFRGAELLFRPLWRVFRCYVIRLGFLDGWAGVCVAGMVGVETFVRYAKLLEAGIERETDSRK